MLSFAGAVLAASVVLGQAEPPDNLLKEYGEQFVGRWIGEVTLIADFPGIGKKGEKIVNHLAIRWIADKRGLEDESFGGKGTSKSLYFLDPASKRIKLFSIDSGGTTGEYEIWKEGGKWMWKGCGYLADGTKQEGKGVLVIEDGGNTYILEGTGTMGGTKTLPLRDVYRRASK